jgi:glycerol-3-phosphate dehydrogenase
MVGAKYTSARWLAELVVDQVIQRLSLAPRSSRTSQTPVAGGRLNSPAAEVDRLRSRHPHLSLPAAEQLVTTYGSESERVLAWGESKPHAVEPIAGQDRVLRCQVHYAVHEEMARRVSDFIMRRTDLGSGGPPGRATFEQVAAIMAQELGWTSAQLMDESNAPVGLAASATNRAR